MVIDRISKCPILLPTINWGEEGVFRNWMYYETTTGSIKCLYWLVIAGLQGGLVLCLSPAVIRREAVYSGDGSLVHHRARQRHTRQTNMHTHTKGQFRETNQQPCFLAGGGSYRTWREIIHPQGDFVQITVLLKCYQLCHYVALLTAHLTIILIPTI